jgi:hypothetical protein
MTQKEATRKTILEAVHHVTARNGAIHLTPETITRETGMSNGLLFYNSLMLKRNTLFSENQNVARTFYINVCTKRRSS